MLICRVEPSTKAVIVLQAYGMEYQPDSLNALEAFICCYYKMYSLQLLHIHNLTLPWKKSIDKLFNNFTKSIYGTHCTTVIQLYTFCASTMLAVQVTKYKSVLQSAALP